MLLEAESRESRRETESHRSSGEKRTGSKRETEPEMNPLAFGLETPDEMARYIEMLANSVKR